MTSDAHALHCPNCGSSVAPGDATCAYCKSTLATVSCPSCFALMFQGAVYCPSCGARRARRAEGPGHAPCPSCRGVMREIEIGDTALLECERCHGSWMDSTSFEHLCADREAQSTFLSPFAKATGDKHQFTAAPRPVPSGEVRYRKCVACGKMMNRINFGRLSGTVVDVCKGHGTFLDAGELHAIVAFIQAGGFDRARQKQIDDLREEESRLRAAQALRQSGYMETRESQSWTLGDVKLLLERITRSGDS